MKTLICSRRRILTGVAVVVSGALAACSSNDALGPARDSPSHRIAFTAFPQSAQLGSLALVRDDGSDLQILSEHVGEPAFSPDGRTIAAIEDGGLSLLVMTRDGSNARTIFRWRVLSHPTWSPDGREIAVMCSDSIPGYSPNICVVSANGTTVRRITHREVDAMTPTWSPDGRQIAFACAPGGFSYSDPAHPNPPEPFTPDSVRGICVANADGSGWHALTRGEDHAPHWSSSTNQIVFVRDYSVLTVIDASGSVVRTWSFPDFSALDAPAWSPDGGRIAFVAMKWKLVGDAVTHPDFDSIYLVNADGPGLTRLTNGMDAETPAWSPN